MPSKTEAIKLFLDTYAIRELAKLYSYEMEVQVTVSQNNGERISGDFKGRHWHGFTDGIQTWKPIRVPYRAMTDPEYTDTPMTWDMTAHAEGIGMTGWNWVRKQSIWVAFDFDAITGHSDRHAKKLSDEEMKEVLEKLKGLDCVTIRKSKSGKGLHVYVFLEPVSTNNHTEHAAVARAILSYLSALANFDFNLKVDVIGGNMWVWHKHASTDGFQLIKEGTRLCKVPSNWKDYLSVMSGRKKKSYPSFVMPEEENTFSQLTGRRLRTPLDDQHKRLLLWLTDNYPSCNWWDAEHHMMVTHTFLLKKAHEQLKLKGLFDTVAKGTEEGHDINCFMFPLPEGAWKVYRYNRGFQENPLWQHKEWTTIYYNRLPELENIADYFGGVERKSGGFAFSAQASKDVISALGAKVPGSWTAPTNLSIHKSGKLLVEVEQKVEGWVQEGKKSRYMAALPTLPQSNCELESLDDQLRHLVTETGEDCGWVIKTQYKWNSEPFQHVRMYVRGLGYGPKEESHILGNNVTNCWTLVNEPFKDEYLKDRKWNKYSAQFSVIPSANREDLSYPTWTKILDHIGKNLTPGVLENEWCRKHQIINGMDWLKCWIASMFQYPSEPLPYLFLYGPQNTGKSIFHEALSLLLDRGVARADTALLNNFNGELEGAVLAVIEETDMSKNKVAYNRIKDWVTSRHINIHKKGRQPYLIKNTLHFVHASNSYLACPIFPGDTRITIIRVDSLEQAIPKRDMIDKLMAEASDFLAEIISLELPPPCDRLNIPCISTEDKIFAEDAHKTSLEEFIENNCTYAPGYIVTLAELRRALWDVIEPDETRVWTSRRISKELPLPFIKGRDPQTNDVIVGNIILESNATFETRKPCFVKNGKLYKGDDL